MPGYPRIPEEGRRNLSDPDRQSFDPFALMKIPSWTAVAQASDWLEGKEGRPVLKRDSRLCRGRPGAVVPTSTVDSTNEVEINVYWNESSVFSGLYVVVSVSKVVDLRQTKWTTIGGVFLPSKPEITNYGDTGNHCRMMKVSDIRVNESAKHGSLSTRGSSTETWSRRYRQSHKSKGEPVFFAMYNTPDT